MNTINDLLIREVELFILILVRVTGIFAVAPIFGRRNLPTYFKIGFSFFVAIIMTNVSEGSNFVLENNVIEYGIMILKELIVGIGIGYVGYLIFMSIHVAGQLIDMQIGFGVVNVLDPVSNIQVPISSNFYYILTMLVFLLVKGHYLIIKALHKSFEIVPLNEVVLSTMLTDDLIRIISDMFFIAFKISAPIIGAIFIVDIALGVMTKTVPSINIFVIGMPIKIMLGVLVMILTVPIFASLIDLLIKGVDSEMYTLIKHLSGSQ